MSTIKKDEALITVLVPVYNAMPFLPYCVESLLKQTEKRIKILIINDGSTDNSKDYLKSLHNHNITILEKNNSGLVDTLNWGIKHIDTLYTARMDADDICSFNRLEKQLRFLDANIDHVLVGTCANHIGAYNVSKYKWPIYMPQKHGEIIKALEQRKSAIIHPTIMVRTKSLLDAGGYIEETWPAEDYDLYFRLGKIGLLANIGEELYSIRLHDKSITAKNMLANQRKYEVIRKKYVNYNNSKKIYSKLDLLKITRNFDYLSVYLYRKGIGNYVNDNKIKGLIFLFISMFLSPKRSVTYLFRKIKYTKLIKI